MATLKVDCVPSSKSESVKGSDTASVTTKELAVMASGGGAKEELPEEDVQGPPSGPGYPSLQVHLVNMLLPVCEFVLEGQDVHNSGPALVLNVPSEHKSHGPPSGPKEPAGHLSEHFVKDVMPGIDVFPDGHD